MVIVAVCAVVGFVGECEIDAVGGVVSDDETVKLPVADLFVPPDEVAFA